MGRLLEEPENGLEVLPPLHAAAWRGDAPAVKRLLATGTKADAPAKWTTDTSYGTSFSQVTALHIAVDAGASEVVQVLLSSGADPSLNMSHVGMGYHMGEGGYMDAWALAKRQSDGAVHSLEDARKAAASGAVGGCTGCFDGWRKMYSKL
eukprot:gnl/TRDRNA2_/TRDRNA2_195037_c0_seq1.p1 gnl/TRDRNA2_/TRDRNA2_195037_c0~~gnl/TRDRNA2_/TRDRNA2_195037_c0_seq1.p1  ORF type:complete len:150 (-),score=34.40 gnl/TRDRNA2_/TRDRNA2_195037_c0_seq1:41-490(-)